MYCDGTRPEGPSLCQHGFSLCDLAFRPVLRVRPGIKGWMKLYFERSEISLPTSWTRNKPIEELITTCDESTSFHWAATHNSHYLFNRWYCCASCSWWCSADISQEVALWGVKLNAVLRGFLVVLLATGKTDRRVADKASLISNGGKRNTFLIPHIGAQKTVFRVNYN